MRAGSLSTFPFILFPHEEPVNSIFVYIRLLLVRISISISIIYLPSGTRGVVAQSPEPEAHDKSD